MKLKEVNKILEDSNQLHLLKYYNDLSENEQKELLDQILSFDFSAINERYQSCLIDKIVDLNEVSPINYFIKDEIEAKEKYIQVGEKVISEGKLALVTIAGGNGTRLGANGPKGAFEIEVNDEKITLFEVFLNQIKEANQKYNVLLYWLIMTNKDNYDATVDFFKQNNFWGYPQDKIIFFKQKELPILDLDGRCVLKSKTQILTGPNGGGDLFSSLKEIGVLDKLKAEGIDWLHISSVDNVLINLVDPFFVGLTIANNYPAGTKSYFKETEDMKEFVLSKYYNRPYLLSHKMINQELSDRQESGRYLFRDICLHNYLFRLSDIERFAEADLRYYKAPRIYQYLNDDGILISSKCYKYEKLIFEILPYLDDICVLRINPDDEFCPLKSMEDYDRLIKLLKEKGK